VKNETILVIEDNELNMKLVRSLLQIGNYTVLEAVNAEDGISLARAHKPDLVLMDIQLPGMDGLAATKILKEDPRMEKIQVVAFSSYAMKGDSEKALESGCVGYISKPIDTRSFLNDIFRFINDGR